jgi:hypothetical protein
VARVEQQASKHRGDRVAGGDQADGEELRAAREHGGRHQERHPGRQPVRDRDRAERRTDRDNRRGESRRVAE